MVCWVLALTELGIVSKRWRNSTRDVAQSLGFKHYICLISAGTKTKAQQNPPTCD